MPIVVEVFQCCLDLLTVFLCRNDNAELDEGYLGRITGVLAIPSHPFFRSDPLGNVLRDLRLPWIFHFYCSVNLGWYDTIRTEFVPLPKEGMNSLNGHTNPRYHSMDSPLSRLLCRTCLKMRFVLLSIPILFKELMIERIEAVLVYFPSKRHGLSRSDKCLLTGILGV